MMLQAQALDGDVLVVGICGDLAIRPVERRVLELELTEIADLFL